MATKKEVIEAIKAKGLDVNERQSKEELENILSTLIAPEEKEPETTEQTETTEQPETETKTEIPDEFADLQSKIEGATIPPETKRKRKPVIERTSRKKKKGQSDPESFRVEGYVLLLIVDTAFPFAFAMLNNMLDKRIKVQANELQLNDKDFSKLEPLADQAADYMAVNLNPIAGFLLIATFMYGNNLLNVRFAYEQANPVHK